MKRLIIPILLTNLLLADCTSKQKREAEMFWRQSIHQESNPQEKFKTLETAYNRCPLAKIEVDKDIAYLYTLSPKERKSAKNRKKLYNAEMKNQDLDVSINHITNNQKKINSLLGRDTEGTLKAVEKIEGIYRADITFGYNSSKLKSSRVLTQVIDKISSEISKNSNAIFGLEGGASSEGSASYNITLSKKRAEALKSAILKQYPIFGTNIKIYANGEKEIICKGGFAPEIDSSGNSRCITTEDKEASRRVTIKRER